MKLKKFLAIFIITIVLILLSATKSEASLYLENLDFTAQINEDGSMDVVETWDISVSETNTLYKTFNKDKTKYSELTNISVEEITNGINKEFLQSNEWKYHLDKDSYFGGTNNDNQYEIAWGVSIDSTSRRQYLIKYTVKDAIKKYEDCAELYWQFVGSDFEISANNITGIIKLPGNAISKDDIKVWGHTKYLNGEVYVTSLDTVEFKVNKYKSGNYVEIRIAMPTYLMSRIKKTINTNKLNTIIEEETTWANEANAKRENRDRNMKMIAISIIIATGLTGIFLLKRISKNNQVLKDNPKIMPEKELEYFRELPDETATPLEAVFMLKKGYNQGYLPDVFAATILNLTLKGHLKLEQDEKDVKMQIIEKPLNNLKEDEKNVLKLLNSASKDKQLTMKELEKYIKHHSTALTNLESSFESISKLEVEAKGKFSDKIANKANKYIAKVVGYILIIALSIVATISSLVVAGEFVGKTINICIAVAEIFLITVTNINLALAIKIIGRFDGFTRKGCNRKRKVESI